MALTPEQIDAEAFARWGEMKGAPLAMCRGFARAIEAAALESQSREIAALKEQVEGLSVKAARYDWLRDESWAGYHSGDGTPKVYTIDGAGNRRMQLAEDAMDEAIDAAIAAKGGSDG